MTPEKLREAAECVLQYPIDQGCAGHEQFAQDLKLAADACTTLAAQMESADFHAIETETRQTLKFLDADVVEKSVAWARQCYLAGQTQMQAKLDAANARVKELEAALEEAFSLIDGLTKCTTPLEFDYDGGHYQIDLCSNGSVMLDRQYKDNPLNFCRYEEVKRPIEKACVTALIAALSTARADCVTLAGEVERLSDGLDEYWNEQPENNRSPAVVDAMGRAGK